jgi:hypothetical protein
MTIHRLDSSILKYIFLKAGSISKLSSVCKLFETTVKTESKSLYNALKEEFGDKCLQQAIIAIQCENKPDAVKIDRLFLAATQIGEAKSLDYDVKALRLHMEPLIVAEGYIKLWEAMLRSAPASLKTLMAEVKFGSDLLANAEMIKQFLKGNTPEIQKVDVLNLHSQKLKALPPEIAHFTGLSKLDISYNFLKELPEEIGLFTKLTELRINHNALKALPTSIGKLILMKNFQCSCNQLSEFPSGICKMVQLRSLNLSKNQIVMLPDDIGNLKALNYLYLDSCALTALPSSISNMQYLIGFYLFNNELTSLPDSLTLLKNLKYFTVQNNHLKALPDNIGGLSALQSLFVDGNEIIELPTSIKALTKLKHLSLGLPEPQGGLLNPSMTQAEFAEIYWGLGENKWKEGIDGVHQSFGAEVYDLGLHKKYAEPGYLIGLNKAYQFLSSHANQMLSCQFYLSLHKALCGHFKGKATNTLMGQEKVGVFRDSEDILTATFAEPDYLMTQSAINEFNDLNGELTLIFGASFRIGDLILRQKSPRSVTIYYHQFSKEQVAIVFNYFLRHFFSDIRHAATDESKVRAIAKFIQRLEWLHSVRDGCGRTDTALLNYLLTIYELNPVLLKFPYITSCKGLDEVVLLLMAGMEEWRKEKGS